MGWLYLIADKPEIDRRKRLAHLSRLVEVWPDLYDPEIFWLGDEEARRRAYGRPERQPMTGLFWIGEGSKAALDQAGEPLPFLVAVRDEAVPIYYGPHLRDLDSLPTEESLRARVLSAHGIAVAWTTYEPSGARNEYRPSSPTDPTFYLRRPRAAVVHLWRLFRAKSEAVLYSNQHLAGEAEAQRWADDLPATDFATLLARFGRKGPEAAADS